MYKKPNVFSCFSPPIMMAVFLVESALAIYTLVFHRMTKIGRLSAAILVLLGLFQFSEYNICGRAAATEIIWSRIGFVAITLLPPLALHLVHLIANRKNHALLAFAYGSSICFAAIFGLSSSAFASYACSGNYAIFQLVPPLGGLYFTYYYFWLFTGIGLCLYYSVQTKKNIRRALALHVCGYLSFLLPTGVVNALHPETIAGIPSIMCGFAVIYAVILVVGIVPAAE